MAGFVPYRCACRRRCEALLAGAAMLLLIGIAGAAGVSTSPIADFTQGIKCQDKLQWEQSVILMKSAAASQQDDGKKVRIYGGRYLPYLPFFYLGLAHFNLQDCPAALAAWQRSLQAGAVQGSEEFKVLENLRAQCQGRASP